MLCFTNDHHRSAGQYTLKSLFPQIQIPVRPKLIGNVLDTSPTFSARKYTDQSTQTMEVISLIDGSEQELKKASIHRYIIWRWMTGKLNLSCQSKVVTGLDGTRTLLWQVVWVEFGNERFARSSARAILGSLLKAHGEYLDDESLLTVMYDTWFPPTLSEKICSYILLGTLSVISVKQQLATTQPQLASFWCKSSPLQELSSYNLPAPDFKFLKLMGRNSTLKAPSS